MDNQKLDGLIEELKAEVAEAQAAIDGSADSQGLIDKNNALITALEAAKAPDAAPAEEPAAE